MHFLKPALKNKRSFNNHVMKTTDNYECIHWVFRPWFREILYDKVFFNLNYTLQFYRGLIQTNQQYGLMSNYIYTRMGHAHV